MQLVQNVDSSFQQSSRPDVGSTCELEIPINASDSSRLSNPLSDPEPVWVKNDDVKARSEQDLEDPTTNSLSSQSEEIDHPLKDEDVSDDSDDNESAEEVTLKQLSVTYVYYMLIKPWPDEVTSQHKLGKADLGRQTCDGWPNVLPSRHK